VDNKIEIVAAQSHTQTHTHTHSVSGTIFR